MHKKFLLQGSRNPYEIQVNTKHGMPECTSIGLQSFRRNPYEIQVNTKYWPDHGEYVWKYSDCRNPYEIQVNTKSRTVEGKRYDSLSGRNPYEIQVNTKPCTALRPLPAPALLVVIPMRFRSIQSAAAMVVNTIARRKS